MKKISVIIIVFTLLIGTQYNSTAFNLKRSFKKLTRRNSKKQLSTKTIIKGLKEALRIGTKKAVGKVSRRNGYYGNRLIRIPLPPSMRKVARVAKKIGLSRYVNDLLLKMNRAAERASKKAVRIFIRAILKMSIRDAKNILAGNDDAATRYFERKTRPALYRLFHPIIKRALDAVGATKVYKYCIGKYNRYAARMRFLGLKKARYDLDVWTTNKALDGLFTMLAKEEKKIRKNPAARVTKLLVKVFG